MGDFASVESSSADHLGSSFSLGMEVAIPKNVVWSETQASLSQGNCWLDVKLFTRCSDEMQHNDGTAMVHAKLKHLSW